MDKLEFAARLAAYTQETKRQDKPLLLWMCAMPVAVLVFMPYLAASTTMFLFLMFSMFAGMIGLSVVSLRRTKQSTRRHELNCPFCNHNWTGEVSRQIVMATGHCGHCGTRVLDED